MNKRKKYKDPLKILGRSKGYPRSRIIKYLPRHKDFTPHLLRKVKQIPEVALRNSGTPLAKRIIHMMREISKEAYRAKQFTRTQMNNHGVLFGTVLLKHQVMDLVLKYFHNRWPQCIVCLYNEYTQKTGIIKENGKIVKITKTLENVVKKLSEQRTEKPYFEDIQFSGDEIFETLYKSQIIKERKNPRYFRQMIPKECYKLPGLRKGIERKIQSQEKNLDEFL